MPKRRFKRNRGELNNEDQSRNFGHPKHLKGKEIGLWYRDRARDKKEKGIQTPKAMATLDIPSARAEIIQSFLKSLPESSNFSTKSNFDHIPESEFKANFLEIINSSIKNKLDASRAPKQDSSLDEKLRLDQEAMKTRLDYVRMSFFRQKLPVYKLREEILKIIAENQIVIVSGGTGCGKTTQIPQYILEDSLEASKGSTCRVICSQPRRISAISVAERVAEERAERLGASVGYKIRLESVEPRSQGSILFCTTGIIIKHMESDPGLDAYTHLILDEIHERDIITDFILAIVKMILVRKPRLKIILMSATLNAEKFADYFNVKSIIHIPGFTYEVKDFYLEDALARTQYRFPMEPEQVNGRKKWMKFRNGNNARDKMRDSDYFGMIMPHVRNIQANKEYPSFVCQELMKPASEENVIELAVSLLTHICKHETDQGAILVFLTGFAHISKMNDQLKQSGDFPPTRFRIIPLHSQMPTAHQRNIFEPPPSGMRKIILSTNIAETSITIDDVTFVIDCGKLKLKTFDPETNEETLLPHWVSLANADQRRGRAGRVKPGVCYHLFSRARMMTLDKYQKPELLRSRLDSVVLDLKILQLGSAHAFFASCLDPPEVGSVQLAVDFLKRLNALDDEERLTPLGYHLARLPVRPQIGKMMLLGCFFSCLEPILNVASALDFRDPFLLPLGLEAQVRRRKEELSDGCKSDHLLLHNVISAYECSSDKNGFCYRNFLAQQTIIQLIKMKDQFAGILFDLKFLKSRNHAERDSNVNSNNVSLIKAIICASLYPNVFVNSSKIRKRQGYQKFHTLQRKRLELHPKSILNHVQHFESPFLVYFLRIRSTSDYVHDASIANLFPLVLFGDRVKILETFSEQASSKHDPSGQISCSEQNTSEQMSSLEQRHLQQLCLEQQSISNESKLISINDSIWFKSNVKTIGIVLELRKRLNEFLELKACSPKCVDWRVHEEVALLKAISELITIEAIGYAIEDFDSDTGETSN